MKKLHIAVLSDFHVGEKARSRDLCPGDASTAPETGYRERFLAFLKDSKITADYLVLPGDVSNRAKPEEFALASEVVLEIAEALEVPAHKVIYVPGNHDVDWEVMKLGHDPTGFRKGQRYEPMNGESWVFHEVIGRSTGSLIQAPYFAIWDYHDLLVVGYNSSFHDDPNVSVHHGLIANESLTRLEEELEAREAGATKAKKKLRIFLVHHHPVQYSDPIPNEPDFSAMTNAGNLLKILRRKHFDLVIHGHKHSPRFETHIVDSGFPLAILSAGSFSSILDTRWSGYVNNQFHIIEVEGRDDVTDCIYGEVNSWTYLCGRGWLESQPNNGIPHISPFGTYLLPASLKAALEPLLKKRFKDSDYAEWRDIVKALPHLRHLQPERAVEVLDDLAPKLSFKRHGTPPDEVILLKV